MSMIKGCIGASLFFYFPSGKLVIEPLSRAGIPYFFLASSNALIMKAMV